MKRLSSILAMGALLAAGAAMADEGDTIWGIDNGRDMLGTFSSGDPGVFNDIGTTGISSGFVNSIEFDADGNLYASDGTTLYSLDRGTGDATAIGGHGITSGETVSDFAFNYDTGEMYAIATSCGVQSSIYTIDLSTGAATFLCTTDVAGACDVGLAFDGKGNLYGHDLVSDSIYFLDLDDCSTSSLIDLPFDSNFGQGLTANESTGLVYHVAFNNTSFQGELYSFDSTGNYNFLGVLQPLQIAGADVEVDLQSCLNLTIDNLVGGENAEVTVTGGEPGHRTVVVWGHGGEPSVFEDVNDWCATFGFDVVLKGRKVRIVGSAIFDGSGVASFSRSIPADKSGISLLFQAAERQTCPGECMSKVLELTID